MMYTYIPLLLTIAKSFFRSWILCASMCCLCLIGSWNIAYAAQTDAQLLPNSDQENSVEKFVYILEDRPDPFVPFITEKAATSSVDMNEIIESDGPLTGMQLFEPGQLNLVALMRNSTGDIAMVEDFTGKGYVLFEGTKIGRRGVVKDIVNNTVIIEETAVTRAGKEIITKVVMTLKKEGEE